MAKMKIISFIPIKLNSSRLPGKNTKRFEDGTPLMSLVQATLLELKNGGLIDAVYIYASDEAVKGFILPGAEFLRRPARLDGNGVRGAQIYSEFVKAVEADIYVLAHATSPFVAREHIAECVERVRDGSHDSAFCAKRIQNFLWKGGRPLNFELGDPPRTQDMEPVHMELSTPYVFTRKGFCELGGRTGRFPYICECSEIEAIDIDYAEDFELAGLVYERKLKGSMFKGVAR
jgi:CMP-N-acetylneuraminic acid synthetase